MKRLLAVSACWAFAGCGDETVSYNGCRFPAPDPGGCSLDEQKAYVEGVMRAHYLFEDQLADIDRSEHEDLSSLLRALTAEVEPPDRFTFVTTVSSEQSFFVEGKSLGFGFSLVTDDAGQIRIREVFGSEPGESASPASAVGLRRGDTIIGVDGESVAELRETGRLNQALFDYEPEDVARFEVDTGTQIRSVELEYDFFVLDPVPTFAVFQEGGMRIGYVLVRNFSQPTVLGLFQAFARLRTVDALVLDLRYNGGGLITAAETLAELIGGTQLVGRIFYESRFNERNQSCGDTVQFRAQNLGLAAPVPIVAIATGRTASASELVINGLRAHTPVDIVGSRSFGKPVGQLGFSFCEKVLRPTTFQLVNAEGEGDFFDGLAPSCEMADDLEHVLGDPNEAMLRASLDLLTGGGCLSDKSSVESKQMRPLEDPRGSKVPFQGWIR
ncbi:MAG: S41 family peptidase [Myxococcota bacterium]